MVPIDQHTNEVITQSCSLECCAELMTLHRSVFRRLSQDIWEQIRNFLQHIVEGTLLISRQEQRVKCTASINQQNSKGIANLRKSANEHSSCQRGYLRSSSLDTSMLVGPGIFFKERNQRATENLGVHLSHTAGCLDSPVIGTIA